MVESDEGVDVFIPTYRNEVVFESVLLSILAQTYRRLTVSIFDNGHADGFTGVAEIVAGVADERVRLITNSTNIGSQRNYEQIFVRARDASLAIVLPSDMGLAPDGLELMIDAMHRTGAGWIKSGSRSVPIERLQGAAAALPGLEPTLRRRPVESEETLEAADVLERFFGAENMAGEYDLSSWVGSLMRGRVWRHVPESVAPFRWHGMEQFVSMCALLSGTRVTFLPFELECAVTGAPRFGTERPRNDFTRLECILATERILRERSHDIDRVGLSMERLSRGQIRRLRHFLKNYKGFRLHVYGLIAVNIARSVAAAVRGRRHLMTRPLEIGPERPGR